MVEAKSRTYNPEHFSRLFEVEDRHFWFRARNDLIEALCRRLLSDSVNGSPRVLEVGCGTGNTLRVLQKVFGPKAVIGLDLFAEGLQYARGRTACGLVYADICRSPFSATFDVICAFDVLEHLPDDVSILQGINRLLTKTGTLFITVPAHPSLWSYFDEQAHHVRRYHPAELTAKLRRTGFDVKFQSGFMFSLFPILWGGRRLNGWFGRKKFNDNPAEELLQRELQINPILNRMLYALIGVENALLKRGWRFPIGSSRMVIARKVRETEASAR